MELKTFMALLITDTYFATRTVYNNKIIQIKTIINIVDYKIYIGIQLLP